MLLIIINTLISLQSGMVVSVRWFNWRFMIPPGTHSSHNAWEPGWVGWPETADCLDGKSWKIETLKVGSFVSKDKGGQR